MHQNCIFLLKFRKMVHKQFCIFLLGQATFSCSWNKDYTNKQMLAQTKTGSFTIFWDHTKIGVILLHIFMWIHES